MDEYIGIIKLFAGNFAPRGFMLCQGQLLSIAQHSALYSILGVTYGGNGQTTFALPDLRAKFPAGTNQPTDVGALGGSKKIKITQENLPSINSGFSLNVSNTNSSSSTPSPDLYFSIPGATTGREFAGTLGFGTATDPKLVALNPKSISLSSPNTEIDYMPPYLMLNYIICVEGIYPSRP